METHAHQILKHMSIAFLRGIGCMAAATEVRCPISRYCVDAAGYLDTDPVLHARCQPRAVVIECKQSRADFLRHRAQLDRLLHVRDHLERVRESIEEQRIKIEEPQLHREGTSLFAELDQWDFSASRLPAYRRVLRRLRRIDRQLYGQTKFFLMARYRLADRLYIAAPRGLIRQRDLPRGWGLLECPLAITRPRHPADFLNEPASLSITVESTVHHATATRRMRWLRNIAVSATRAAHPRDSEFAHRPSELRT